jgi:hypothetical protein
MAWLWKQGRPTLLAVVGAGVLGYKAFHRGRAPVGQGHAAVGVGDPATAHHAHQAKALVMDLLHRVRVDTYWDAFFVGSSGTPQRGSV